MKFLTKGMGTTFGLSYLEFQNIEGSEKLIFDCYYLLCCQSSSNV